MCRPWYSGLHDDICWPGDNTSDTPTATRTSWHSHWCSGWSIQLAWWYETVPSRSLSSWGMDENKNIIQTNLVQDKTCYVWCDPWYSGEYTTRVGYIGYTNQTYLCVSVAGVCTDRQRYLPWPRGQRPRSHLHVHGEQPGQLPQQLPSAVRSSPVWVRRVSRRYLVQPSGMSSAVQLQLSYCLFRSLTASGT